MVLYCLVQAENDSFLQLMIFPKSPADFLELALQFGMIMMFACAFPLAFVFATLVGMLSCFLDIIADAVLNHTSVRLSCAE